MLTAVDHIYRYRFESAYIPQHRSGHLVLAADTSAASTSAKSRNMNLLFFTGRLHEPKKICALLRGVSDIVAARFNNPNWRRLADPVITVSTDRIRFEGFSSCCSAYARADLLPDAAEGKRSYGTTNVDFNPAMISALDSVSNDDSVSLNIGAEEFALTANSGKTVERKVSLPVRWLKGFSEIQSFQSRMVPVIEVSALEGRKFLASLPKTKSRSMFYILPSGRGLRLSQVAGRGGVKAAGLERLAVLNQLIQYAENLRIYGDEESGTSNWELILPETRFHLLLSCDVWRGFSGEGQVLEPLAAGNAAAHIEQITGMLSYESNIDIEQISRSTGLTPEIIRQTLAVLGTRGLAGYDLGSASYYHRVLPFDLDLVEQLQPRLLNARKLIDENKVRITLKSKERTEAFVQGTDVEYFVRLTEDGAKCTCQWYAKHQGSRGPCKHILAAELVQTTNENEGLK